MNRCFNCKHWDREDSSQFGQCCSDKFVEAGNGEVPIDGLEYSDYEGYSASFRTGSQFGCIHFQINQYQYQIT